MMKDSCERHERPCPGFSRANHPLYVIVPAGGLGTRFGSKKQFAELGGKPLLVRTLEGIRDALGEAKILSTVDADGLKAEQRVALAGIIVAVPREDVSLMNDLLAPFRPLVVIVEGGSTRAESVKSAYHLLRELRQSHFSDAFVAVHDGCRPFASTALWEKLLGALCGGADFVLPYTPVTDTVKSRRDLRNVPREDLIAVQTPQMMRMCVAEKIYLLEDADASITDDATLAERCGFSIALIRGEKRNLKITDPEDLALAEKWGF